MFKPKLLTLTYGLLFLVAASGCANRPPLLSCVADSTTVLQGRSVRVDSNATDPERKPLTYQWSATSDLNPNAVTFGPDKIRAQNGSATYDTTGVPLGRYTIRAAVSDQKNTSTCDVDIVVEKNKQAPTIACEPSSVRVTEEQSTTLRASASDPNGDALSYSWAVDGQSVTNNQSSFEFGTTGRSVGVHTVRVTATDVDDMSASCNFNVTIDRRPNDNPSVTLTLNKDSVYAGDSVLASARASDPDGDPVTYSWTVDGQRRSETASSLTINTSGLAGGRHSVSVTAQDDRGGSGTDTKSLSVREKIVIQVNALRVDNVAKAQLDEIALKMRQNPQLRAQLTGHTDDRGSEANNQRYGLRRAQAVQAYLVDEQKVDAGRIQADSAGESQPVADNSTEQGRRDNRRVEVELYVP